MWQFFWSVSSVLQGVFRGQTIPRLQQAQRQLCGYTSEVVQINCVWIKPPKLLHIGQAQRHIFTELTQVQFLPTINAS